MLKYWMHLFIGFIFCCSSTIAAAQEDTAITYDTVVAAPEISVENYDEEEPVFDSLTGADAMPVKTRSVDRTAIEQMRKDDDFWYYNSAPEPKKPVQLKTRQPQKDSGILSLILWIIVIGGFVAFLIWFLMSSNVQLFRKAPKKSKTTNEDINETEDIFEINFEDRIAAAIKSGNYRLAVRLMYLRLLTQLSAKGLIQYRQQQTNREYVDSLFGTTYYKDFFKLTRHFEYTWYGQLPVSESAFNVIRNDFNHFENSLPA